jgi:hypothetical protein
MRTAGLILFATLVVACSRTPDARDASAAPQKRLSFSVLEDYDKGQDLNEVARDFDLFAELGVSTWRGSFGWDDYEPTRGRYDFEWLHRFATLAEMRGITLRPYIGYTPAWVAGGGSDKEPWNDPPADLEAWSRFVSTLVTELRPHRNVVSYEIYNEENTRMWWDGSPVAYREVLRRAIDAIDSANPDAQVLLGGMVFPDTAWIDAVCDDGGSGTRVDVIPFHAYPETWTPADVTVETYLGPSFESGFVSDTDDACGRKPIWINETGYATTPGRAEADQAHWWARAIATFAAEPRVEHIGIYEIKDAPRDRPVIGDAPNYYLGLADVNRRKKIAFGTVAWLVSALGSHPFAVTRPAIAVSNDADQGRISRYLFTRSDGRRIVFLWARGGDATVEVDVGGAGSRATEYAIDGRVSGQLDVTDGRLRSILLRTGRVRLFEISR